MVPGPLIADSLARSGFTHVVWLPDSHLGTWDEAVSKHPKLTLIRPCREGEAVCLSAGLMLGGARPLVAIQCTGFFEAGDAVRNVVHDLKLPLKLLVGVRSWKSRETTKDNCPALTEPVVKAWGLPYSWFDPFAADATAKAGDAIRSLADTTTAQVLLWGE